MDASLSPQASEPDDSPPGTRTYISDPAPGDGERVVARFRCESPDGWAVAGQLSRTWRGLAITSLHVEPWVEVDTEPGHITSSLLRQIPTGGILAAAQAAGISIQDAPASPPKRDEKRQPGRQPLSDDLIRDVALRYLTETGPGKPRGAVQRLAEHYGKPAQTISRWVMRARADGWLGPAVPGREGGAHGRRLSGYIMQKYDLPTPFGLLEDNQGRAWVYDPDHPDKRHRLW